MSPFSEMEWNAKWDWENMVAFGSTSTSTSTSTSKAIESSKKPDWTMVDDDGSFNLSSAAAGSSRGSSAKSSVTDSSCKDGTGMHTSIFKFTTSHHCGNFTHKIDLSPTSSAPDASLLGLKLGKRTYFENTPPTTTTPPPKKTKSSTQNAPPICCQVEGCNLDLSLAKEYHRKHRVCNTHSKCPKVVVGGRERRFCQQCSRFHSLSEFDEKKRSCRRRLSDHNARRRKPRQETIHFNSSRLSTPFYGGTQQMSFLLDSSPLVHSRIAVNSVWNNSKFTLAKGYPLKSEGDSGGIDEQLHMPGIGVPQAINMQNAANGLSASKNTLNPGSKGSLICSLDAAPEYRRALSLLSSNSWDSCNQESMQLHHQLHENSPNTIQPMYHAIPEGVPFSSSELWPTGPHPTHQHVQSLAAFKTPYDGDFCSNLLN